MNETQKRIREYKAALPGLRERVLAVALLLMLSTAIMTVASFAWFTLSRAPEVSGISTQIAANGNLEIALSGPDGITPPGKSAVGDSSAAEGQTVINANQTWGNLINLSDADYGLENIILRPAILNNSKLGSEPFRSVIYGSDGRVSHDLNSKFSYCTWEPANAEIAAAHFGVTGKYGVRAIATVTERFEAELGGTSEDMVKYYGLLGVAESENTEVQGIYPDAMLQETEAFEALATVMGYYMQARLNSSEPSLNNPECTEQIGALSKLYNIFLSAMEQELDAMVALANVQQFVYTKSDSYIPYTAQTLRTATTAELTAKGIRLKDFNVFITDLNNVEADAAALAAMAKDVNEIGRQVYTNDIRTMVDHLVTINSCQIIKSGSNTSTTIGSLGASDALGYLSGTHSVIIQEGILARFEQRTGAYVNTQSAFPNGVKVTVKIKRDIIGTQTGSVKAHITTKHYMSPPSLFAEDVSWTQEAYEKSGLANGKKILTAGDTYGLAVDFWVRTNAGDEEEGLSYLVLEGKLQYEQATGTDKDNNPVGLLYSYTVETEGSEEKTTYYVYQTEDGKWYEDYAHHESNNAVTDATLAGKLLQVEYQDAPVGYKGENRVWEEIQQATLQPPLSEFNTTQGSGSCYTFYADSPQDQQMILNLLKHMYVVFTDGGDGYLSMAQFDTEENHYYAVGGKVTVPLVVMHSNYAFTDENGESVNAVTVLRQDQATRITALVYLDGRELSNKEALAATDVQGVLNIQFGNNIAMTTLGDSVLQEQERVVTASVETANADNKLDFYGDELGAKITVTVTGDQPASVKAFFQREINAFQGSRQQTMTFRQEGENWVCDDYEFPAPGKYVLRSVILDGVEYELREMPSVTVEGILLRSLNVTYNAQLVQTRDNTIMTADNKVALNLAADFATNDPNKMPKKLVVEFVRTADSSTVSVDMTATTTGWTGTANLTSSGYYQMAYVLMDGVRYDLGTLGKTFDMYLGLNALIETMPGTPQIVPLESDSGVTLGIRAKILDNSGNGLHNFDQFPLVYRGESTGETLEAVVSWNAATGYYEGNFHLTQPDTYRFYYLEAQGNYISAYKSAVVFRARSNKPASYVSCDNSGNTLFIMPDDNISAELMVNLRNTGGAQINAYFTNEVGNTYMVGEDAIHAVRVADGITTWNIPAPTVNDSQAGQWRLTKLALGNVTDSNGREYTLQNPLNIILAEQDGGEPTISVFSDFEAIINYTGAVEVDGTFMEGLTVNGMSVKLGFKDGSGNLVQMPADRKITDVTLHYAHQNDSEKMGGYKLTSSVAEITLAMSDSGDGITYNQTAAVTLRTAGTYKLTSITYKQNGIEKTAPLSVNSKGTQFVVKSAVPTVTVSAISPTGENTAVTKKGFMQYSTSSKLSEISSDKLTATVYNKGKKSGLSAKLETYPQVKLHLDNAGEATKASMTFTNSSGDVLMYTGQNSGKTAAFSWTRDSSGELPDCLRYIGQYETSNIQTWSPAGDLTSNTLVLTYDGVTYSFTVPMITIKNPI